LRATGKDDAIRKAIKEYDLTDSHANRFRNNVEFLAGAVTSKSLTMEDASILRHVDIDCGYTTRDFMYKRLNIEFDRMR